MNGHIINATYLGFNNCFALLLKPSRFNKRRGNLIVLEYLITD